MHGFDGSAFTAGCRRSGEFGSRDGEEGVVEVVEGEEHVFDELLEGKIAGGLSFALGALLEVAEVGDGAEVLVLPLLSAPAPILVSN